MAKPHSSEEETLWHNRRTCPDSGLHCGIGSHCLTDSCRKNEEEEEEETQACKWQVKKLPEKFAAQKLRHIVSRVCYEQNIN